MPIDMTNVIQIMHGGKEVVKIEDSNGGILWQKSSPIPTINLYDDIGIYTTQTGSDSSTYLPARLINPSSVDDYKKTIADVNYVSNEFLRGLLYSSYSTGTSYHMFYYRTSYNSTTLSPSSAPGSYIYQTSSFKADKSPLYSDLIGNYNVFRTWYVYYRNSTAGGSASGNYYGNSVTQTSVLSATVRLEYEVSAKSYEYTPTFTSVSEISVKNDSTLKSEIAAIEGTTSSHIQLIAKEYTMPITYSSTIQYANYMFFSISESTTSDIITDAIPYGRRGTESFSYKIMTTSDCSNSAIYLYYSAFSSTGTRSKAKSSTVRYNSTGTFGCKVAYKVI